MWPLRTKGLDTCLVLKSTGQRDVARELDTKHLSQEWSGLKLGLSKVRSLDCNGEPAHIWGMA